MRQFCDRTQHDGNVILLLSRWRNCSFSVKFFFPASSNQVHLAMLTEAALTGPKSWGSVGLSFNRQSVVCSPQDEEVSNKDNGKELLLLLMMVHDSN